jgi:hypothetical protein
LAWAEFDANPTILAALRDEVNLASRDGDCFQVQRYPLENLHGSYLLDREHNP